MIPGRIKRTSGSRCLKIQRLARALKMRQRMRLKRKAKNLSTDDLVEVLTMRAAAQKATN